MTPHIRTSARQWRHDHLHSACIDWHRVAAFATLGIVSTAWTVTLAGMGAGSVVAADRAVSLPDAIAVPNEALAAPVSVSMPESVGRPIPEGSGVQMVSRASVNGIPAAALAAYQRSETVINSADSSCNINWQLIAAIGRVESDHGRYGGNILGEDGVSRPGIFGIALDGSDNTSVIRDTDAGQFDNDEAFDRAVGPMQFIPSTWSQVGVDADGDAQRNPQDIDDAALASAVYLCSGSDNLGTDAGRRSAVYRYNHSLEYVDLVLSIMGAYLEGDYTSVPTSTTSAMAFTPHDTFTSPTAGQDGNGGKNHGPRANPAGPATDTVATPTTAGPTEDQSPPPPETDPVKPIKDTVKQVEDAVQGTVTAVLTLPQAILKCTLLGYNALLTPTQWNACITEVREPRR